MEERQTDLLRLQPHMIPALRATFLAAVDQVEQALANLARRGYLPSPWLGDETSTSVAAHYTHRAMDDPDSSHRALQQYRAELDRIHDTLKQVESDYLRTEAANTAALRPMT